MKILGIDPGLRKTGFGVIEQRGSKLLYIASGVIKTGALASSASGTSIAEPEDNNDNDNDASNELAGRLRTIMTGVRDVIERFGADCAAIEKVFVNVNPQSTLLLGQARGAAICGIVLRDVPVQEYTALQIKKAVTGHGKAQKEQVQEMVRRFLDLPGLPGPDAADALAVAICHAHSHQALAQLRKSDPRSAALGKSGMRMRGGRLIG